MSLFKLGSSLHRLTVRAVIEARLRVGGAQSRGVCGAAFGPDSAGRRDGWRGALDAPAADGGDGRLDREPHAGVAGGVVVVVGGGGLAQQHAAAKDNAAVVVDGLTADGELEVDGEGHLVPVNHVAHRRRRVVPGASSEVVSTRFQS